MIIQLFLLHLNLKKENFYCLKLRYFQLGEYLL